MPTTGRHKGGRVLLSPGGGYEGGKRSRSRRANEKRRARGIYSRAEHGARVSRTPKQKSKRKATIRKQPGEKATQKPKSENRSRKPKRRTKTKRAYL